MQADNSMSERILRTLETIITSDAELNDFSVVPTEGNATNKSPVLYEHHNLGLESWCIKHVYRYAYVELFEGRMPKRKMGFQQERDLNRLLMGVLLINPDVSSFWNMKRELVDNEVLEVDKELHFAKIVLSYKSKSNEAFTYRRWLLKRVVGKLPHNEAINLLHNELSVCSMAAGKSPNNYHAWTHRIWTMETLQRYNVNDIINNELAFSQNWVSQHVSEHTGYHYRQFIFKTIKNNRNITNIYDFYYKQVVKFLHLDDNDPRSTLVVLLGKNPRITIEETTNYINYLCLLLYDLLILLKDLSSLYSNHESLWYHRRFLLHELVKTSYDYHGLVFGKNKTINDAPLKGSNIVALNDGEKQAKLFKSQPNRAEASFLYETVVKLERDFIRRATGFFDVEFGKRHEKWLEFVLGMRQEP